MIRTETARPLLLIALLLSAGGCTRVRPVPGAFSEAAPGVHREINRDFGGKRATVAVFPTCATIELMDPQVQGDSLLFLVPRTGASTGLPITEVARLTRRDRGQGAKDGAKVGLGVWGGLLVASLAVTAAAGEYQGDGPPAGITIYFAALAGPPVLLLSTVAGAAVGSRETYVFPWDADGCPGT